jgi:signal transduction histidine kinase
MSGKTSVCALVAAALALGDSRQLRGQALAERDESRRAMADTLRNQAVMEERARIARELHDVVAHHISAIVVQAEATRLTTTGMPEEGVRTLEQIGASARGALTEMRRVLGVLRDDAGAETGRNPLPGLDRLPELVETAREAGATVRLTLSGRAVPLSPGVDLCAYRIVQEALTNARRHAPGAEVELAIAYGPDSLQLRVADNGPGPAEDAVEGHGIVGMYERAVLVGGTLRSGAGEHGGFVVEAILPIRNHEA